MNINEKKYGDLSEAVAFVIRFAFMICIKRRLIIHMENVYINLML